MRGRSSGIFWTSLATPPFKACTKKCEGARRASASCLRAGTRRGRPTTASATLVLAARYTIGSKSRYAHNWLVRGPVALVGLGLGTSKVGDLAFPRPKAFTGRFEHLSHMPPRT